MRINAPFTAEQIANLNAYQASGWFHEFTCGNDSRHRALVATPDGWVCPDCAYTQSWAHDFMAQPLEKPPHVMSSEELKNFLKQHEGD